VLRYLTLINVLLLCLSCCVTMKPRTVQQPPKKFDGPSFRFGMYELYPGQGYIIGDRAVFLGVAAEAIEALYQVERSTIDIGVRQLIMLNGGEDRLTDAEGQETVAGRVMFMGLAAGQITELNSVVIITVEPSSPSVTLEELISIYGEPLETAKEEKDQKDTTTYSFYGFSVTVDTEGRLLPTLNIKTESH